MILKTQKLKEGVNLVTGCVVSDDGTLVDMECTNCAVSSHCDHKWKKIKTEVQNGAKVQNIPP